MLELFAQFHRTRNVEAVRFPLVVKIHSEILCQPLRLVGAAGLNGYTGGGFRFATDEALTAGVGTGA